MTLNDLPMWRTCRTAGQAVVLIGAAMMGQVLIGQVLIDAASAAVPLPQPRPSAGPPPAAQAPAATPPHAEPEATASPAASAPSACRLALTAAVAIAPSLPPIHGPGQCGGEDIVRLEAVVLADKSRVPLHPAATLRCSMATAIADWVRSDVAGLAAGLGTKPSEVDNFDSFDCRGRNRVVGAKLSEHGRANALDIRAVKFANGQSVGLTDRHVPRGLREQVLRSVCKRFATVLGPGSDGYHEDHIHLDLAERRNNYRICHWNVLDDMPPVARLLPAVRPGDAPPPEVAAETAADAPPEDAKPVAPAQAAKPETIKSDQVAKADRAKSDQATRSGKTKSDGVKSGRAKPDAAKPEAPKPAIEPDVEVVNPPVTKFELAKPKVTKPEVAKPEAVVPLPEAAPAMAKPATTETRAAKVKTAKATSRRKSRPVRRQRTQDLLPPPFNLLLR